MRKHLLLGLILLALLALSLPALAATFGSQSADIWGRTTADGMRPVRVSDAGYLLVATGSNVTAEQALKIVEVDSNIYVGTAAIGSAEASAVWQARKINTTAGVTTVKWADGNANYDNVATNLQGLTYN